MASLRSIKLLHTAVWLFFVLCILAIPITAAFRQFRATAIFSAFVLLECLILALNNGHCPLTPIAARYTENRAPNFDIYLPQWLARYNKTIFGSLFLTGEAFALWQWWRP
ncbi:MAG: hypothetical protein JST93_23100 [Acidobacteria bacterium]|nr:hypothetical protein [Acidobacteriota bacterium]